MKYAIRYYKEGFRVMGKADEIIIKYPNYDNALIDFATKSITSTQRLIVNTCGIIEEDFLKSLPLFKEVISLHNGNFAVMTTLEQPYAIDLYESNIPFFFEEGITNFTMLHKVLNMGVSDVFIKDDLGFYLKNVRKICNDFRNVKIRVKPNVAQSESELHDLMSFFIRPDDLCFYEPYIDVIEFAGPLDAQNVLYDIYNSEKWLDSLEKLILNLDDNIDNRLIIPVFGEVRVNCKKRCSIGKCEICPILKNCSKLIDEKGLLLLKEKEK